MAHDELEFTRAPRENLQTYARMKKMIAAGATVILLVLIILGAWLV